MSVAEVVLEAGQIWRWRTSGMVRRRIERVATEDGKPRLYYRIATGTGWSALEFKSSSEYFLGWIAFGGELEVEPCGDYSTRTSGG